MDGITRHYLENQSGYIWYILIIYESILSILIIYGLRKVITFFFTRQQTQTIILWSSSLTVAVDLSRS